MEVYLGLVTKRTNSTLQPALTSSVAGQIVEPSNLITPRIKFYSRHNANYAWISDFGRYYWIDDWTFTDGFWYASMHSDVLASFKSDIGTASRYVLRSAAAFDGSIVDFKYPAKSTHTVKATSYQPGWAPGIWSGMYVVGVITPYGSIGSTALYCLNNAQFATLRSTLMTNNAYFADITDQDLQNLAIAIGNPMQYITFVKYYPLPIVQGTATNMVLGKIVIPNMPLLRSDQTVLTTSLYPKLQLDPHPLAATRGTYLNTEPFTRRYISWEPLGWIQLPGNLTQGKSELRVDLSIDLMSGTGAAVIGDSTDSSEDLYRTNFAAGVDIPVAQMISGNPLHLASSIAQVAGGVLAGLTGNIAGAVNSGLSGIGNALEAMTPQVTAYKAGSGSLLGNDPYLNFIQIYQDVVDEDNAEYGRPLCEVRQLSTLTGYQLVRDGDIPISGTAAEQDQIRQYLESGYFYE